MESTPAASTMESAATSSAASMASSPTAVASTTAPSRHGQARRQHNDQCKTHNRFQARIHWYFSGPGR
jgi:hypothetical protein